LSEALIRGSYEELGVAIDDAVLGIVERTTERGKR
jgi:hypothetical protein